MSGAANYFFQKHKKPAESIKSLHGRYILIAMIKKLTANLLCQLLLLGLACLLSGVTYAAMPPAGCTLVSGTTYNCSSLNLTANETSLSSNFTLNVTGGVTTKIGITVGTSTYKVNIVATGNISISNGVNWYGNLTASSGTISIGNSKDSKVFGNVTAGTLDIGSNGTISGSCTANTMTCSGGGCGMVCSSSPPTVSTTAASSLTTTSAQLNATVTPWNSNTNSIAFEYGLTTAYGSTLTASPSTLSSSSSASTVAASLTGLTCNTTYHYRAKATNTAGTSYGSDVSFTTASCAPTVTTTSATSISADSATINGTVISNGSTANTTFSYGTTNALGTNVAATPASVASGTTSTSLTYSLTGLSCNTTYYFRANATNTNSTANGSTLSFTTAACLVITPTISALNIYQQGLNPANPVIRTKIAGISFNLEISASGSNLSNQSLTVELLNNINNPTEATTISNCANWTQSLGTTSSLLNSSLIGTATFTIPDAYRNVRAKIVHNGNTYCSSDNFAIRPNSLSLIAQDADSQTAGTNRTLDNVSALGGLVHKAGQDFPLTIAGMNGAGTPVVTTNYAGTIDFITSACTGTACTSKVGTLSPTKLTAAGGAGSATATYSEVGSFAVAAQDSSFADVDNGDTPEGCTETGRYICSNPTDVGRFVPDHFAISDLTPSEACPKSFSYFGQDGFATAFKLTAQNKANETTTNYNGTLKLPINWLSSASSPSPGLGFSVSSWSPSQPAGATLQPSSSAPTGGWNDGVATISATHPVSRPSDKASPTTIALSLTPVDADNVSSTLSLGNFSLYFGQLRLSNVFGSGSTALSVPVSALYWTGNSWAVNSADSCTTIDKNRIALSGQVDSRGTATSSWSTAVQNNGSPLKLEKGSTLKVTANDALTLSAPTNSGTGSINIAINLGITGTDTSCLTNHPPTTANSNDLSYLRGFTAGCGVTTYALDPSAKATFGVYAPESKKMVFTRELF